MQWRQTGKNTFNILVGNVAAFQHTQTRFFYYSDFAPVLH